MGLLGQIILTVAIGYFLGRMYAFHYEDENILLESELDFQKDKIKIMRREYLERIHILTTALGQQKGDENHADSSCKERRD